MLYPNWANDLWQAVRSRKKRPPHVRDIAIALWALVQGGPLVPSDSAYPLTLCPSWANMSAARRPTADGRRSGKRRSRRMARSSGRIYERLLTQCSPPTFDGPWSFLRPANDTYGVVNDPAAALAALRGEFEDSALTR